MRLCSLSGFLLVVSLVASAVGCGPDGAPNARRVIREMHMPEVRHILADDITRHLRGVDAAAERVVPGFAVTDPVQRESQMRTALRKLTKPPRGIPELIASARTFTAALGTDGVVIATDATDAKDLMTGADLGRVFPVVRDALSGKTGYAVHQFPALEKGIEGSWSLLFAAPARKNTQVVGVVLAGIPLWRLAQRFTRQIQLDHGDEKGAIFWVYMVQGQKLHHFGTPPDLDTMIPDAQARAAGLAVSPGGFTGEFLQFGRWYGYGVAPLPRLGAEYSVVVVRSDPI